VNILEFLDTPELMGDTFTGPSWEGWRAIFSGAFAVPMDEDRTKLFKALSGGRNPPSERVRELWIVGGRRIGKTQNAGAMAVYLATVAAELEGLNEKLSRGERGIVALIAVDRSQASIAMCYIRALVNDSPTLSSMVTSQSKTSVEFSNNTAIVVFTNSFRGVRGRTLIAAVFDECAFFRSDQSANPDTELYRAAQPGLATTGGLMCGISSPYAKRGLLYDKYRKHYGRDGDVLVIQASTEQLNPAIDRRVIEEALKDDPEAAQSEWLGLFRQDLEAFVGRETIEALVRPSPLELPFNREHRYFAFTDPTGGGADEFGLAIAHLEGDLAVIDLVRGLKGIPAAIVAEYAPILKAYGIYQVHGDHYAGSWPADEFRRHGISYIRADKPKSDQYKDCLPMLNSGRVQLPPDEKLILQLANLERRTHRSGKDSIDHPVGGHDDRANVVAGVMARVAQRKINVKPVFARISSI
jgi:hypothetical protein